MTNREIEAIADNEAAQSVYYQRKQDAEEGKRHGPDFYRGVYNREFKRLVKEMKAQRAAN